MTLHEMLIAAKALIPDEDHWWRGEGDEDDARESGRYCPFTAIEEINGVIDPDMFSEFCRAAACSASIGQWNDAPERTLSEVHAAFDAAISATALREKGNG